MKCISLQCILFDWNKRNSKACLFKDSLEFLAIADHILAFLWNWVKPSSKAVFLLWIIHVISVVCWICFCARLFLVTLWSPSGKGLYSRLSFVMSNCELVTLPLISWVRCGTLLYRFPIFVLFITFPMEPIRNDEGVGFRECFMHLQARN